MYKTFLAAFPSKHPVQVDTLQYVFANLAFEHQHAIVRVVLDADHRQVHAPWIEAWTRKNYLRLSKLAAAEVLLKGGK